MGLGRGKYLKTRVNKDGYEQVTLGSMNNRNGTVRVHRIIAELFVPNDDPLNKTEVNHKDFNRLNNDYSNLDLDATNIQSKLADPKNMEFLKSVLTKLG